LEVESNNVVKECMVSQVLNGFGKFDQTLFQFKVVIYISICRFGTTSHVW